jgi:hypothetical protein
MAERDWLARYATIALLVVGGLEWLLGRTVSRLAANPVLTGTPRSIVEVLGSLGYFVVSSAFIVAVVVTLLGAMLAGSRALIDHRTNRLALACYLALFAVVVATHTLLTTLHLIAGQPWLSVGFNLLAAIAVWWLALTFTFNATRDPAMRVGIILAAVAYSAWYFYVVRELSAPTSPSDPQSGFTLDVLNAGELAVIAAPFAFFWAVVVANGEWRHRRRWIAPIAIALLFAAGNLADMVFNMGFTGVFATWSLGLNLVWPWPLYAVALALYVYAIITAFSSRGAGYANANTGAGLILLLFAGSNLQLTYQYLVVVTSLALLTGFFRPFGEPREYPATDGGRHAADDTVRIMRRPSSAVRRH